MSDTTLNEREDVREVVRQKYGAAALTVLAGQGAACCGGHAGGGGNAIDVSQSCCGGDVITGDLYSDVEAGQIPEAALLASLGCGNPTALAQLNPGEVVLDLGSGGGIDVLLSARRVGPTGFAFELDMTDEMLQLAERNKAEAGTTNVTFLKGHIEAIPLPDASVDVIISNCVINLSADKDAVLREAFRVLRPGGRFAVSNVVVEGELPAAVRADMEAYVGCVAGALEVSDYIACLERAGFVNAGVEPTRRYTFANLEGSGTCYSPETQALAAEEKEALDGRIMGAFVRAEKPLAEPRIRHVACHPAAERDGSMKSVLFVCVHNAGRSQMAEVLVNHLARERGLPVRGESAGTVAGEQVNPAAVEVMREIGVSMDGQRPKQLTAEMADAADRVITMECGVDAEACPTRVRPMLEDWGLDDPKGQPIETVRAIRDQIVRKVEALRTEVTAS